MGETTQQALFALAAPLLIVATLLLPGIRRAHARDRPAWYRFRIPIAAAAPVALAFIALYGRPVEQWQSVLWVVTAGAVLGLVMALTPRRAVWRVLPLLLSGPVTVAAIWPVLSPEPWAWKVGLAAGVSLLGLAIEPLAARRQGIHVPGAMALATGTAAGVILVCGFLKLAVPTGALAIALAGMTLLALVERRFSFADGAVAVVVPIMVTTPLVAWLYASSAGDAPPLVGVVLPALVPLVAWVGEVPPIKSRRPWAATLRWVLLLAVCAAAVGLALVGDDGSGTDDPYEAMYQDMMGGG